MTCHSTARLLWQQHEVDLLAISAPPHLLLDLVQELPDVFNALLSDWEEAGSICIKPPAHSGTSSVARLHNSDDLLHYLHALHRGKPHVKAAAGVQQQLLSLSMIAEIACQFDPAVDCFDC